MLRLDFDQGAGACGYGISAATDSMPAGIVTGPDGNLWFADRKGNQIARIRISADSIYGDGFDLP